MAQIIKFEDLDLFMELDKESERFADMGSKVKGLSYKKSHETAFFRISVFIEKERLNLLHEVDDEKLKALIDEGAKRDG